MKEYIKGNKKYTNLIDIYKYINKTDIMNRKEYMEMYNELHKYAIKESKYSFYDTKTMTKHMSDNLWFSDEIGINVINDKESIEDEINKLELELENVDNLKNKIQLLSKLHNLKGDLNKFKYDDEDELEYDLYDEWDEYYDIDDEMSRENISPQHQYELDYEGDTYDCEGGNYEQDLY